MKNKKILFAVLVFFLPVLLRVFWFYQGFYFDKSRLRTINFDGITEPLPEVSANKTTYSASSDAKKSIIVVDDAHHNYFDLIEIDALVSNLISHNAEVLVARSREDFLDWVKKADAILTIAPSEDFPNEEVEALEEFTQRGGRIVVFSDPTHPDSSYIRTRENAVEIVNDMLQPFKVSFNNDYLYNLNINEGNFRNVYVQPQTGSEITSGIEEVVFYGARSIDSSGKSVGVGLEQTFSSLTDTEGTYSPLSLDLSGNVLAVGDVNFLSHPFNEVADNFTLIENISGFMVNAPREINLKDWPYLFSQDVVIEFTEDIILDDDLLTVVADLQYQLGQDDLALSLGPISNSENVDHLILGIYPPEGELEAILSKLGFTYPGSNGADIQDESDSVENTDLEQTVFPNLTNKIIVPEFGEIPSKGFGFVMFEKEAESTRLVLIADSQENSVNLLRLLVAKNLEGCLVGRLSAVCDQDISPVEKIVRTPTPFSPVEELEIEETADLEDEPTPEPFPEETLEPTPTS